MMKKQKKNRTKIKEENKPLTTKQKRFVEEYCKDFNGKQAAIRAGYTESNAKYQAARMLTYANLKKAIDKRIEQRKKKLEITEKEIISELIKIGFSDVSNYYESNFEPKDITILPNELTAAIKEVVKIKTDKGTRVGLKFYSKEAALELLGKHLGMWKVDQTDKEWHVIVEERTIQT